MISLVDVIGYGRGDILVEFKIEEEEFVNLFFLSQFCKSINCYGIGFMVIYGLCGYSLWDVSRNFFFGLFVCERVIDRLGINNNGYCLFVEEKINFVFFNLENGSIKWQIFVNSKVDLFKFVNDIDGDGERDIVFVQEYFKVYEKVYLEGSVNLVFGVIGKIFGNLLLLLGSYGGSNVFVIYVLLNK